MRRYGWRWRCSGLDVGTEGTRCCTPCCPQPMLLSATRRSPMSLAADVYANPQHPGRGGWSWYTGAAGWFYRTAVEELLGLRVREGRLYIGALFATGVERL
ncbi:MAG: GH36-type glycosyl hydrolase domain-containing protein [Intestinimonas sp.]